MSQLTPFEALADPELTLNEVMERWPQTIAVFLKHKMLCVGCLVNPFHTISDACAEYHLEESGFRQQLDQVIRQSAKAADSGASSGEDR